MKNMCKYAVAFILWIVSSSCLFAQSIVINELMASNKDAVFDADYHQSGDWIELFNSGLTNVPLDGYYLTDDPSNLQKWRISNTTIAANQYLLVWADGYDAIAQSLHANFKLSASGEWVALVNPGGAIVDSLGFGRQFIDISYGREAAHLFNIGFLKQATPKAANQGSVITSSEQCPMPTVQPESGYFQSGVSVNMAPPTGDAVVHYTLDGSPPTPSSPVFTSPLTLNATTVFRARCFSDSKLPSDVATRSYLVGYHSTLPVVSLASMPRNLWDSEDGIYVNHNILTRKEWERAGVMQVILPDGQTAFNTNCNYRLFGRTAIYLPEKSFGIFPDAAVDYQIFPHNDVSSYKSFVLRSASDDWDNMMFSDAIEQLMFKRSMGLDSQAYQPAVLFINGDYFGIHNFREKYNENYFKSHHGIGKDSLDLVYVEYRSNLIEPTVGSDQDFRDLMDFADHNDLSTAANYDYFTSVVDIDNYIKYVVAECYVANVSWEHNVRVWRSTQLDNKWRWVLFDLDRGMLDDGSNTFGSMVSKEPFLKTLINNPDFKQKLREEFLYHLNTTFQPNEVIALVDSAADLIRDEMPAHIERWKDQCANNACGISSMAFWEGELERRRNFARNRPAILLQQISSRLDLNNTVEMSVRIAPAGGGIVMLDDNKVIDDSFAGIFAAGDQRRLSARPSEGYAFSGWYKAAFNQTKLVPRGSVWSYWDEKASPGSDWKGPSFDDSAWKSGPAQLGYGDGDEATVISYGGDEQNKNITYWFRRYFTVSNLAGIDSVGIELLRDDGAIVYINGQEVVRSNMPAGAVDENTTSADVTNNENDFRHFEIDKSVLQNGDNIVAVEVHQTTRTSSDVSFDLELTAGTSSGSQLLSTAADFAVTPQQDLSLLAQFNLDAAHNLPTVINAEMTLTAAGSPFIAEEDVTVQSGAVLTLEPGARLLMAPGASIVVHGGMNALGTADAPVLIEPLSANGRWGGLSFASAQDTIRFAYVTIRGATTPGAQSWQTAAVSAENADIRFDHVRIVNVNDPFALHTGSIIMNGCELDGTQANDDICHVTQGYAVIENCILYGDAEVDFDVADNSIIRGNLITIQSTNSNQDAFDIGTGSKNILIEGNRVMNAPDKGASIGEGSTAVIRRNVFINCGSGVGIKDNSYADVINNTFYRTAVGIHLYEKNAGRGGGSAIATNNIFANSKESDTHIDDKSNIVITYSLSNTSELFGINNLFAEPLFVDVDNLDLHLAKGSPAIDAGDPASPKDPDGSRADIGAFYYNATEKVFNVALNEICSNNTSLVADPAGEFEDWIELYNPDPEPFDLSGLYLTDDLSNPAKWRIPGADAQLTTILSKNVLLIWLDNDLDQEGLHAPFKLNAAGEEVGLYYIAAGDTVQIDMLKFDVIGQDKSIARFPDGSGAWVVAEKPSPGQLNGNTQTAVEIEQTPTEFALLQNYPNPFNPQTTIGFDVPEAAHVRLEIYDLLGRRVKLLKEGVVAAGRHRVVWDATNDANMSVSAGLYFYSIHAANFHAVKKLLLVK